MHRGTRMINKANEITAILNSTRDQKITYKQLKQNWMESPRLSKYDPPTESYFIGVRNTWIKTKLLNSYKTPATEPHNRGPIPVTPEVVSRGSAESGDPTIYGLDSISDDLKSGIKSISPTMDRMREIVRVVDELGGMDCVRNLLQAYETIATLESRDHE